MNKVIRKTTGTVLGLTLAIVSGAPALADDTELLLVAPADRSQLKPNVMFILDTSGSMTTVQETGDPYDPIKDYSGFGSCDRNSLYYTDSSTDPVCDAANMRYIDKSAWHCADSKIQIDDVGRYTGILAQYRNNISGVAEWLELEATNTSDVVECESDQGLHG